MKEDRQYEVGDRVFCTQSIGGNVSIRRVVRVTRTQAILDNGVKLVRNKTGFSSPKGSSMWGGSYYELETSETLKKYKRQILLQNFKCAIKKINPEKLTEKELESLTKTIKEITTKHNEQ